MAQKPVVWSLNAQQNQLEILNYWIKRNGSSRYADWLLERFHEETAKIGLYPLAGRPTTYGKIRMRAVKTFAIFYEEKDSWIEILLIWDQRRDGCTTNSSGGHFILCKSDHPVPLASFF